MNYQKLSFFSVITVLVLIAGCKGDTGPAGPGLSGSITGVVQLFNSDGSQPIDRSGVTVSIPGTSFSTTTDSLGQWTISNLTSGSYTITETKPGYGMSEQQDVQLVSGTVVVVGTIGRNIVVSEDIIMAQPPDFTVSVDSIPSTSDSTFNVWFTSSGLNSSGNYFLIAIGNDSYVNATQPNSYIYTNNGFINTGNNHGEAIIYASDLEYAGFKSGMTAYLVVYPLGHYYAGPMYSSYYDIAAGRTIYTSLGTSSKVFKVTIP